MDFDFVKTKVHCPCAEKSALKSIFHKALECAQKAIFHFAGLE